MKAQLCNNISTTLLFGGRGSKNWMTSQLLVICSWVLFWKKSHGLLSWIAGKGPDNLRKFLPKFSIFFLAIFFSFFFRSIAEPLVDLVSWQGDHTSVFSCPLALLYSNVTYFSCCCVCVAGCTVTACSTKGFSTEVRCSDLARPPLLFL